MKWDLVVFSILSAAQCYRFLVSPIGLCRFTFCAQDPSVTEISPGQVITYVKCRDGWEVKPSKKRYSPFT